MNELSKEEVLLSAKNMRRKEKHKKFIFSTMDLRAKIIGQTKYTLTATAALMLMAVILWPIFKGEDNKLKFQFTSVESGIDTETKMQKPSFFGVDKKNQPFNVSGTSAIHKEKNIIEINDIAGDLVLEDKSWLSLSANKGTIDVEKKYAKLEGKVNIILNNGFEINTESAEIDFQKSFAFGNTPVVFQGPPGVLTAEHFEIYNNGNKMLLKNNVELTIQPKSKK